MPSRKRPIAPKRTARKTSRPRRLAPGPPRSDRPNFIVGVGASAGGLEAFIGLLQSTPPDAGLAFVLLQHLAPKQESHLVPLLAPRTPMPVVEAVNGARILANHVYVTPPNVQVRIARGCLALSPRPADRTQHTPIDVLLTSLAASAQGRAIGVVLSGTASDGAQGLREIKAAGGLTFAQTPESAKHDGMPRAAIATGMVDQVMTPSELGAELGRIARLPYVPVDPGYHDALLINDEQLQRLFELLRGVDGLDFRHYKTPTIRRRLLRRMTLHRLTDVGRYIELVQDNATELRALFQDLLIHVTRFFREPESFEALDREVLPRLLRGRDPERPLRVWVCGCATGEEAYSMAMLVADFLAREHLDVRVQIFATDVSETAIDQARAGIFPPSIAADVGTDRLRRFFTRSDGRYRVNKVIRDMCVFAKQDLTKDPPFSRLDLVLCRNVLIYMDTVLQKKLITLFHYALNPSGYLVLGHAETVGTQASLFALMDKKHRIHRKKSAPVLLPGSTPPPLEQQAPLPPKRAQAVSSADPNLQTEVSRIILDRYAPAGVVVDNELQIVQFRGQTGAFLEPAPGDASLSLLKMAREGLLYGLRTALQRARTTKAPVKKTGLRVRTAAGWQEVAIDVLPITTMGRPHFLVLFELSEDGDTGTARRRARKPERPAPDDRGTTMLRRELAASREYLQSIIQELEAANEELQSANEEILSSNEELQSTNEELDTAKEELQSTNEELNTLNDELQSRNEEMSRVNSDLMNLVGSVQIAIVIVGSDLRIRRFTPMAERVLNLIPADLDRAIGHINPNIDCPNLEQLIAECIDSVSPLEREVQDRQGRWYSLRIRPYKNLENKIDGAVLALFDVDILKKSEQRARLADMHAEALLRGVSEPLALVDQSFMVRSANGAFAGLFNMAVDELRGRTLPEVGGEAWQLDEWRNIADPQLGSLLQPTRIRRVRPAADLNAHARLVPAPDGPDPLILVTISSGAAASLT